jgi:hypothetical protein
MFSSCVCSMAWQWVHTVRGRPRGTAPHRVKFRQSHPQVKMNKGVFGCSLGNECSTLESEKTPSYSYPLPDLIRLSFSLFFLVPFFLSSRPMSSTMSNPPPVCMFGSVVMTDATCCFAGRHSGLPRSSCSLPLWEQTSSLQIQYVVTQQIILRAVPGGIVRR